MRRYITYDIDTEKNDYQDLYNFLENVKAKKLSESSYYVDSNMKFDVFCDKLKASTSSGDNVIIIFKATDGIDHKKIR